MGPANRFIVNGQRVTEAKVQASKNLRRNMTEAEAMLWQALRRNQLDGLHFRRQQVVDGFVVDFYCHVAGLVIELDGDIHAFRESYDRDRENALRSRGLKVLRIRNEDVKEDLPGVLGHILRNARGAT